MEEANDRRERVEALLHTECAAPNQDQARDVLVEIGQGRHEAVAGRAIEGDLVHAGQAEPGARGVDPQHDLHWARAAEHVIGEGPRSFVGRDQSDASLLEVVAQRVVASPLPSSASS